MTNSVSCSCGAAMLTYTGSKGRWEGTHGVRWCVRGRKLPASPLSAHRGRLLPRPDHRSAKQHLPVAGCPPKVCALPFQSSQPPTSFVCDRQATASSTYAGQLSTPGRFSTRCSPARRHHQRRRCSGQAAVLSSSSANREMKVRADGAGTGACNAPRSGAARPTRGVVGGAAAQVLAERVVQAGHVFSHEVAIVVQSRSEEVRFLSRPSPVHHGLCSADAGGARNSSLSCAPLHLMLSVLPAFLRAPQPAAPSSCPGEPLRAARKPAQPRAPGPRPSCRQLRRSPAPRRCRRFRTEHLRPQPEVGGRHPVVHCHPRDGSVGVCGAGAAGWGG